MGCEVKRVEKGNGLGVASLFKDGADNQIVQSLHVCNTTCARKVLDCRVVYTAEVGPNFKSRIVGRSLL